MRGPDWRAIPACLALLIIGTILLAGCQSSPPASEYDLIIQGGHIIDGTGSEGFDGDIAVRGDRIVRVARDSIPAGQARSVIDATGLIVAPGFIDQHAHVQSIHNRPLAESFVRQGITSIVQSLHSHDQHWPLEDYMDALEVAPNVGFFAGHNWTRRRVSGTEDRPSTAEELDQMGSLVRQSMEAGALGLSTGLRYVPGAYAETDEVIELAKVAAEHDGIYVSHMRDEGPGVLASIRELIMIAKEAGLPAQAQHIKAMGTEQWGMSQQILAIVDSARAQGLDIRLDVYPYTATSTSSRVLFPAWALAGGPDSLQARLAKPALRKKIKAGVRERILKERGGGDLSNIQFARFPAHPEYAGQTLADFASDRGLPNNVESGIELRY